MYRFSVCLCLRVPAICLTVTTIVLVGGAATAQGQTGVVNPLNYPGADLCIKIQAAITANASANPQGLVIDARSASGGQHCSVNPLSGATVPGQLLLGAYVLQTTAPIMTPSVPAWQIIGVGRGNTPNNTGTLIQAVSGFPTIGDDVVRLGDGASLTFGNRIENLAIDCNGIAKTIGLYSTTIQEQSGGSNLLISNCPVKELWINGSGSDGTSTQFASNYDFHDVEALAGTAGTATTIACEFDGDNVTQPSGPHLLSGLTCSGAAGHPIETGIVFDSFSSSTITNVGAENAATGFIIGNLAPLNGVTFSSLMGGSITGSVVHIQKPPVPANHNVTTDIELSNVLDASGTASALIQDDVLLKTIISSTGGGRRALGTYRIGDLVSTAGSALLYTNFTDSPLLASQLQGLTLNNGSDSSTGNLLKISSGATTTTPSMVEFDDRGTAKWKIGKESNTNFALVDPTSGENRIEAISGSATSISAAGSGSISLNPLGGTGGVNFCNGSGSCTASVAATGAATFTSVAIPGFGASTKPLCTTTGGVITNVGCSALAAPAQAATQGARPQNATAGSVTKAFPAGPPIGSMEEVAPRNSPSFTDKRSLPSLAGVGAASFSLGKPEVVGGGDATVLCAADHQCDSFSGTLRLTTGSEPISESGSELVRISLPIFRQSIPNCIVNILTATSNRPWPISIKFSASSSFAIVSGSALAPSTPYDVTYLCGGN